MTGRPSLHIFEKGLTGNEDGRARLFSCLKDLPASQKHISRGIDSLHAYKLIGIAQALYGYEGNESVNGIIIEIWRLRMFGFALKKKLQLEKKVDVGGFLQTETSLYTDHPFPILDFWEASSEGDEILQKQIRTIRSAIKLSLLPE